MALNGHDIKVIHSGSQKSAVGGGKPCRFNDGERYTEAGAKSRQSTGILRDIGLKQDNVQEFKRFQDEDYVSERSGQECKEC